MKAIERHKKMRSPLKKLLEILKNTTEQTNCQTYWIPDLWNAWDYAGPELDNPGKGEIAVDPYRFYGSLIEDYLLPKAMPDRDYTHSLSSHLPKSKWAQGQWIKESSIYSMMVRTSTSWDHDHSGQLETKNQHGLKETGTFVKTLALLPLLKKMGIDTLYLLPLTKFSLRDKKGDLGSPYAVSNFFELDPALKDPLTGTLMSLEEEFQALVEACHILGIRVLFDIIPRTNSVESDLILEHPDWFYWIKEEELTGYAPPIVPDVGSTVPPTKDLLPVVYAAPAVQEHIAKFQVAPNEQDIQRWRRFVKKFKKQADASLLDEIKKEFGVTTAPAFSDYINDIQPPWTDVTFFRLYLDHPLESQAFVQETAAPYILFDTIKSNRYKGALPNEGLWKTIVSLLPHYQDHYGIDGARIDMGHALPSELVDRIIAAARKRDPDFCFIAEELNAKNAEKASDSGYNAIISDGFITEPRFMEGRFHDFIETTRDLACPAFACGETHDTPRLAARLYGPGFSKMMTILNHFLPNGIPFLNSGQEIYEVQPMNLGLDCYEEERYRLPATHPFYGKLALFDKIAFDYHKPARWDLPDQLDAVSKIRRQYLATFTDPKASVVLDLGPQAIGIGYHIHGRRHWQNNSIALVVGSLNTQDAAWFKIPLQELRQTCSNIWHSAKLVYSTHEWHRTLDTFDQEGNLHLYFHPFEVKIIIL